MGEIDDQHRTPGDKIHIAVDIVPVENIIIHIEGLPMALPLDTAQPIIIEATK